MNFLSCQDPSQNNGTITFKAIGAEITNQRLIGGTMRLFCRMRLGQGILETMPDKKNGNMPKWGAALSFSRQGASTASFEIYHMSRFCKPPKLVGECTIPLDAMSFIAELGGKCVLKNNDEEVGYLDLQIKWQPENGAHQSPIASVTFNNTMPSVQTGSSFDESGEVDNSNRPYISIQQPLSHPDGRQMPLPHFESGSSLQEILENFNENISKRVVTLQKEDEPIDPNLPEDQRCVVCLEKKKAGVFYKCGHNCCCSGCGLSFIGSRCPICREFVFDFIKVFNT